MPFPIITSVTQGGSNTNVTSYTVPWPTTGNNDILIGLSQCDGGTPDIPSFPSGDGWVHLSGAAGGFGCQAAYVITDGTEAGTFTMTHPSLETGDVMLLRILAANWHGTTVPEDLLGSQNNTNAPDVGELTASWGAEDNLWIVWSAKNQGSGTVTTFPLPDNNTEATVNGNLAFCSDELNQAALNPDAWLWSVTDLMRSGVIVLRPAALAAGINTTIIVPTGPPLS